MIKIACLALTPMLSGCHSIVDIDVSKSEPVCVRQCTTAYSQCVSIGLSGSTMRNCKDAYSVCVSTCPPK
jgi:hypothetical protein